MLRKIAGIVAGYVVVAILVFATFTLAYLAMGTDGAFRPGTYEVSHLWLAASIVLGLAAAVVGGLVCRIVSRSSRASLVLALLVLVLGLVMAFMALATPDVERPSVRAGDVGNTEAMNNARQPDWLTVINPFLGAFGVMIGARLKGSAG